MIFITKLVIVVLEMFMNANQHFVNNQVCANVNCKKTLKANNKISKMNILNKVKIANAVKDTFLFVKVKIVKIIVFVLIDK